MRSVVADMTPKDRRASAFGVFNTGYGICWFAGSALIGVLYSVSLPAVVIFSVATQLAAVPLYASIARGGPGSGGPGSVGPRNGAPPSQAPAG